MTPIRCRCCKDILSLVSLLQSPPITSLQLSRWLHHANASVQDVYGEPSTSTQQPSAQSVLTLSSVYRSDFAASTRHHASKSIYRSESSVAPHAPIAGALLTEEGGPPVMRRMFRSDKRAFPAFPSPLGYQGSGFTDVEDPQERMQLKGMHARIGALVMQLEVRG